jgi:t-SNARE complex subunit (syntaxin)
LCYSQAQEFCRLTEELKNSKASSESQAKINMLNIEKARADIISLNKSTQQLTASINKLIKQVTEQKSFVEKAKSTVKSQQQQLKDKRLNTSLTIKSLHLSARTTRVKEKSARTLVYFNKIVIDEAPDDW